MGYRGIEGEGCGVVEGWVSRGWIGVVGVFGEGLRVGWEGFRLGFEGGFEGVLSSVQH